MKTETFMYDEGYGYGEREISVTGMTVDEVIEKLTEFSKKGRGDRIVFDACWVSIEEVRFSDHPDFGMDVVQIF